MKTILLFLFVALCLPSTRSLHAQTPTNEIVVEAFIDGNSELRVKKTGIYWINAEDAKPGKHGGANFPTYINGQPWQPVWGKPRQERGQDKTSLHSLMLEPDKMEFTLLTVTATRGGSGIEKRDEIKVGMVGDELSIFIPDTQSGARWYKFSLRKKEEAKK
jgi:hypothetical protein